MGSGRILDCAVNVKAEKLPGEDILYTVSGIGAERLHMLCYKWAANIGELTNGSQGKAFAVKKSDIKDSFTSGNTPIISAIQDGLEAASGEALLKR